MILEAKKSWYISFHSAWNIFVYSYWKKELVIIIIENFNKKIFKIIEKDKKSIAFLILMQDTYKTLEEEQVNNIVKNALKVLQQHFDANLR